MSPGDLGQALKPFVFLDLFDDRGRGFGGFGLHPHSGIATLTYLLDGAATYEDTTGASGVLPTGGIEWMVAGGGAWHGGGAAPAPRTRGFQLWIALPPDLELGDASSTYLAPSALPMRGPVTLLLGEYEGARSDIAAPSPINYLAVRLKAGERWRYEPPEQHTVLWAASADGEMAASGAIIRPGEMAVFAEDSSGVDFVAESDTLFVLGSAAPHPHRLNLGNYSVHTSPAALAAGEARIVEIRRRLAAAGRL
jgi:redox-sensitive bicupin YhaK (pirin superfamily)